jgi:hypothetical protein
LQATRDGETPHQFKKPEKTPWAAGTADMHMDIHHPAPSAPRLPMVAAIPEATNLENAPDGPRDLAATPDF